MIWLLCGYMWLYIHRPFEVWPWLGEFHIERIYMLVTIGFWIISRKYFIRNRLNLAFASLILAILFSGFLSPYSYVYGYGLPAEDFMKVAVFYVLVITTLQNEKQLKTIIAAFLVAMSLYMAHSLREYMNGRYVWRMGISRMVGVDLTFNDPNTFAATIIYSLPIAGNSPFCETALGGKRGNTIHLCV
jgi:hypothetical protein